MIYIKIDLIDDIFIYNYFTNIIIIILIYIECIIISYCNIKYQLSYYCWQFSTNYMNFTLFIKTLSYHIYLHIFIFII